MQKNTYARLGRLKLACFLVASVALLSLFGFTSPDRDSGGQIPALMLSYDVLHYDLQVTIDPTKKYLTGKNTITARSLSHLQIFQCHLDESLTVTAVTVNQKTTPFRQALGQIEVNLSIPISLGAEFKVTIEYAGHPVSSDNAPWKGGFVWQKTREGQPWIGVTCQGEGGDLWWPCKDDPADEPDRGMGIQVTAPKALKTLTNGRLLGYRENDDDTATSTWAVSYPINTYLVTLNIGPYEPVYDTYHGVNGTLSIPIIFWAVPEHLENAKTLTPQIANILRVLGRRFGEYPYVRDKFWIAETPYLGMEHQTIIAYGASFEDNSYGFDTILLHEIAHEWWGNHVTAADWADFWIPEGFATYAEALYTEETLGRAKYLEYMREIRSRILNRVPLVVGRKVPASKSYHPDVYNKGAFVLHNLRYLVGDDAFFDIIYRFATQPEYTNGNNIETKQFIDLCKNESGSYDWFWQRYLYQHKLPNWTLNRESMETGDQLVFRWDDEHFEMPVTIRINGRDTRYDPTAGVITLVVPHKAVVEIDPEGWLLAERS